MGIVKCFKEDCHYWDSVEPDKCAHPWQQMSECPDAILEKVTPRRSTSFYIDELKSEECQCGEYKARGKSVCPACWKRLPRDLQVDLYSRMGDGYEEAYEAAVKVLTE